MTAMTIFLFSIAFSLFSLPSNNNTTALSICTKAMPLSNTRTAQRSTFISCSSFFFNSQCVLFLLSTHPFPGLIWKFRCNTSLHCHSVDFNDHTCQCSCQWALRVYNDFHPLPFCFSLKTIILELIKIFVQILAFLVLVLRGIIFPVSPILFLLPYVPSCFCLDQLLFVVTPTVNDSFVYNFVNKALRSSFATAYNCLLPCFSKILGPNGRRSLSESLVHTTWLQRVAAVSLLFLLTWLVPSWLIHVTVRLSPCGSACVISGTSTASAYIVHTLIFFFLFFILIHTRRYTIWS